MGESEGGGTCEGDVLVDKEERGDGDAGGGLDFGDNGADAVAEGGGLVELCSEGLELCVHDGRRQGVGNGGGVWRGGGAEAAQGGGGGRNGGERAGGRPLLEEGAWRGRRRRGGRAQRPWRWLLRLRVALRSGAGPASMRQMRAYAAL
jgi:hypothetical protein